MYTYGAPRVGNSVFAQAFNACVASSWRFHNLSDIVPTVPRLMGYCHVNSGEKMAGACNVHYCNLCWGGHRDRKGPCRRQ